MKSKEFGARLRVLRKQAGFSQRELASKIGVNFSYLSKIESGAMPPPSEKVVLQLADALNADKDELLTLAGKIPADIAQILKDRETLQLLRSRGNQKKVRVSDKISGKIREAMTINFKNFSRVALAIMLVVSIGASLWFASPTPVRALEIAITDSAGAALGSGTFGSTYTFQVKITIEADELLPIRDVSIKIYNADFGGNTYFDAYEGLSHVAEVYTAYPTGGDGNAAYIKTTPDSLWGYSTSGVTNVTWRAYGYLFAPVVGGYGYASGSAATSLTYDFRWTPSTDWQAGDYKIAPQITAQDGQIIIKNSSSFALSHDDEDTTVITGAGGAAIVTPEPAVVITDTGVAADVVDVSADVSTVITDEGVFVQDIVIETADATLTIAEGASGTTAEGLPLEQITVATVEDPTDPPADKSIVSSTVDLGPDGAEFPDGLELTIPYNDTVDPDRYYLVIAMLGDDGEWDILTGPFIIDETLKTIKTTIFHFTQFTVLAEEPVVEEPVVEKPVVKKPVVEKPVVEKPVVEKPVVEKPVAEKPVVEKPVVEKPVVEEPAVEEPTKGTNWTPIIAGIAGAIVIIVIIWLVIRRRR